MIFGTEQIDWLLMSDEPWTRYRTLIDLVGRSEDDGEVVAARAEMVAHAQVRGLVETAVSWPGYALKRHNDARHPIYAFSTLADFGIHFDDDGVQEALEKILEHQSVEGAFQTKMRLYKQFGGLDGEHLIWMGCDAPTLLYALLAMGMGDDARVQHAVDHLVGLVQEDGWRCSAASDLGNFRGPGRKDDPCPIVNVYALKALAQLPEMRDSLVVQQGAEMLLWHWAHQGERKLRMFGIGTDFRKLKYPFVWYDVLHVVDVLSRFPFVYDDVRFREMLQVVLELGDENGRFTATSMFRAWKGWSFADKKRPSPWLSFLVYRIQHRVFEVA